MGAESIADDEEHVYAQEDETGGGFVAESDFASDQSDSDFEIDKEGVHMHESKCSREALKCELRYSWMKP